MLQPKTYPELMGKALVLEAEPFVTLVDDDNPWVEGLFLVLTVGVILGVADLVGGLLMTASLPPVDATREAVVQGWRQLTLLLAPAGTDLAQGEAAVRQAWAWAARIGGYGGGWARLWFALLPLAGLLVQWVLYGGAAHVAARLLGGQGKLGQTLGATALVAAPYLFVILEVVPFVTVRPLLLAAWTLLITYRAVAVAHELAWRRAVVAALAAPVLVGLLSLAGAILLGIAAAWGGMA